MTSFAFVLREARSKALSPQGRYEYRIWPGRRPPMLAALQKGQALVGAETRADIYLLSVNSRMALIKLRDGQRLEIKRRARDRGTLQHWWVALSEDFPLSQSALGHVATALLIPKITSGSARLSPAHLLAAMSRSSAGCTAVTVRKSRLSFRYDSCRAEITRVSWANRTGLTVALEDPDPDHAERAVAALGLGQWPNLSYGDVLSARPRLITKQDA